MITSNSCKKKAITPKQAAARRQNGRKSHGPKTASGKERSRLNALKHGLFAKVVPARDQPLIVDKEEYNDLIAQLMEDMQPRTQLAVVTIEALAFDIMKLQHLHAIELVLLDKEHPAAAHHELDMLRYRAGKKSLAQCQSEIEILLSLQQALEQGKKQLIDDEHLDWVSETLWTAIQWYERDIERLKDDIEEAIEDIKTAPESKRQMFIEIRKSAEENLNEAIEENRQFGRTAHGAQTKEDVRRTLIGTINLDNDRRDVWIKTVEENINAVRYQHDFAKQYENGMADMKRSAILGLSDELPRLSLFAQYGVMIRRNIERHFKLLKEQAVDIAGGENP